MAHGQDSLKLLPVDLQGAAAKPLELPENQPYTLHWGDARFLAATSLDAEYNDNIGLASTNIEHDFILRPKVTLDGFIPLTDVNSFSFTLGVGYEAYTEHTEDSRILITPGSALSFDFLLKDFRINIHDRVSYENDPSLYGNVSGVVRIGGLNNTAGISVSRDLGAFTGTLGYDHLNFVSSSSEFANLNNGQDIGSGRFVYHPREGVVVGVEAAGGATEYEKDELSGYENYNAGVVGQWQLTSNLRLTGRGGYVDYLYDSPALTQGNSSEQSFYAVLSASGALNEHFKYNLEGGHQSYVSVDSGFVKEWYVALSGALEVIEHGILTATVEYENAKQPFENAAQTAEIFSSKYERVASRLTFAYPLMRRLDASLTYGFYWKDAVNGVGKYTQNDVLLGLVYRL